MQDIIQTCIKLRMVLITVQILKKIKKKACFASKWDILITEILTNYDQTPTFNFILTYKST